MKTFKVKAQNENTSKVKGPKVDFSVKINRKLSIVTKWNLKDWIETVKT